MTCRRCARSQGVLLPKFGVVIGDLAHQLFDHGPATGLVQGTGQFGNRFGNRDNDFVRIDGIRLVGRYRIFGKKAVDGFDDQAVQARPFFVLILFVGDGSSPP